jgi:NTE family protein
MPLDLALQGGGSHGAFTWGVLDALLEDGRFSFDGVSGTSAGALNAAVLATGLARGGADAARRALEAFWLDIAGASACFGALPQPAWPTWPAPAGIERFNLDLNPWFTLWQQWLKVFSPYQFNPLGLNPLREVVERHVDAAVLRSGPLKLFVCATVVSTGRPKVFAGPELGIDALMASACLPHLFKAVEIGDEAYWDGGYTGNPALWPLIYNTAATDVLLVRINPLVRPALPDTADEIEQRIDEIAFNAGLAAELRAIHFVRRLLREERIDRERYKALRLHMVADDEHLSPLAPSSKLNTERSFLLELHALGRAAARRWLEVDAAKVGRENSLDIGNTFLAPRWR